MQYDKFFLIHKKEHFETDKNDLFNEEKLKNIQ